MRAKITIWNKFFTSFSDSPTYFDTRSDEDTEKNVLLFASVATALAKYDLPVPKTEINPTIESCFKLTNPKYGFC